MPRFSKKSLEKLRTCDPKLQIIALTAIDFWDFTVLEGHRSKERQAELVEQGVSQTLKSKHTLVPSKAMDLAPYYPGVPRGGIDWRTDKELFIALEQGNIELAKKILENIKRWLAFSGFIRGVAAAKGFRLRSGADWDSDQRFNDHSLVDLVHFELID